MKVLVISAVVSICLHQCSCNFEGLFLTKFIKNNNTIQGRELSRVEPEMFAGVKSFSGYFNVNPKYNSQMFFWYFPVDKPESDIKKTAWIIWLNGGPGCSSMLGLFTSIGPIQYSVATKKVIRRNVTWASDYSLVFVDNPVGTGFSFTDDDKGYTRSVEEVSDQLHEFLLQFLIIYPELQDAPLFIAGSSYAGKYVPAFAWKIHENKQKNKVNLRGISLLNALVDPEGMMPSYNEVGLFLGFLDDDEASDLKNIEEKALRLWKENKTIDAANAYNKTIEYLKRKSMVSIYNFLDEPHNITASFEHFINRLDVRKAIHAGSNTTYDLNNQKVYTEMLPDIMNSTKVFVERLLEHYGVMSYNGQLDLFVPYYAAQKAYKTWTWSRAEQYRTAPRVFIKDNETDHTSRVVAYKKSGGNFIELMVRNGGHCVPCNQPEVAKYLMDGFIKQFVEEGGETGENGQTEGTGDDCNKFHFWTRCT